MVILVFDLDDTLLMSNSYNYYNDINENKKLNEYLKKLNCKKFIYTNGIYNHALTCLRNMNILNKFNDIFSRDTLDYYKPNYRSYNEVCNKLYFKHNINNNKEHIIFFDDLISNLDEAKKFNWITVWIHPQCYDYSLSKNIDYCFPNILSALEKLKI
jgi:FMN phosphatase YigB (HAD superfamily)